MTGIDPSLSVGIDFGDWRRTLSGLKGRTALFELLPQILPVGRFPYSGKFRVVPPLDPSLSTLPVVLVGLTEVPYDERRTE